MKSGKNTHNSSSDAMAVYTKVSDIQLENLLANYDIGSVESLREIEQGIENSNYFLDTDEGRYVLTIYEKRVNKKDLPFYINLMQHLSDNDIPCPIPVQTKSGDTLSSINGKQCAIVTFLAGKSTKIINSNHLAELGMHMAHMHNAASDFKMQRSNNLSIKSWNEIFESVKGRTDEIKQGLADEITQQLQFLSKNWPTSLPVGIIHADLFPDNVFFKQDKMVGVIDFYFACNDFLMYDIAICLNAWCFEKNGEFNITKAKALLASYNKVREISEQELEALPVLSSGAAMRFLLTRLYDWFNQVSGALVKPHDPLEYLNKLRFHNGVKSHTEYGL